MAKDKRKVLNNIRVEANGAVARFTGKYDPIKNVLKVYKYNGDINIMDEALQNYAIEKGIALIVRPQW